MDKRTWPPFERSKNRFLSPMRTNCLKKREKGRAPMIRLKYSSRASKYPWMLGDGLTFTKKMAAGEYRARELLLEGKSNARRGWSRYYLCETVAWKYHDRGRFFFLDFSLQFPPRKSDENLIKCMRVTQFFIRWRMKERAFPYPNYFPNSRIHVYTRRGSIRSNTNRIGNISCHNSPSILIIRNSGNCD